MGALRVDRESSRDLQSDSPVRMVQSEAARDKHMAGSVLLVPGSRPHPVLSPKRLQSHPGAEMDHTKVRRFSVGLSRSHFPHHPLPLSDGDSASSRPGRHLPVSDVYGGTELRSQ